MVDEQARLTVGELLQQEREEVVFLCSWDGDEPKFRLELGSDIEELNEFAEVTLLALRQRGSQIAERFAGDDEEVIEEPAKTWEGPLPQDGEGEEQQVAARPAAVEAAGGGAGEPEDGRS
jgi:hypothetical protein